MMTFEKIQQELDSNVMPTYARFPAALVSGKNATAKDADGKEYIDFTSGIGVNCLGYADAEWAAAVAKQAATIQHISNLYYSPVQAELAEKLCKAAGMGKVFFCNSGAEANECCIKLARKYGEDVLGLEQTEIVTLKNSFHGRTVTTLAATGQEMFHELFLPLTDGFRYADTTMDGVKACVTERTCAVLVELIQGEGGVVPMDAQFVKAAARLLHGAQNSDDGGRSADGRRAHGRVLLLPELRRAAGRDLEREGARGRSADGRVPLPGRTRRRARQRNARLDLRREPGGVRGCARRAEAGCRPGIS